MQGLIAFLIIVSVIVLALIAVVGSFVFRIFHAMREAGAKLRNKGDDEDFLRGSWNDGEEIRDDDNGYYGSTSQGSAGQGYGSASGYGQSSAGSSAGQGYGSTSGYGNASGYGSASGSLSNQGYGNASGYGSSSSSETITIIDMRGPSANRRIYEDDEGEYVEFTEVK